MPKIDKIEKPSWIDKSVDSGHSRMVSIDFYHTTQWREIRQKKLSMNPICEHCEKRGKVTPGKVIDHIIPIQFGGSKTDLDNLQSLCSKCDAIKTAKDKHIYNHE